MTVKWEDIEPGAMLRYDFGDSVRHVVAVADGRCWVTYATSGGGVVDGVLRREFIEENYTLVKPFFEVGRLYELRFGHRVRIENTVTLVNGVQWAFAAFLGSNGELTGAGVLSHVAFERARLIQEGDDA